MKVSILVPIYGVEKYIERCAISLFEQTYENIEYIFVNDCTKDNSISILKNVIERYPTRKSQVRIIEHEHNKGLGGARNTAVANAVGDFLMHVDSDDYIDVTCVEKCVKAQEETSADIVSFASYIDWGHGNIKQGYDYKDIGKREWDLLAIGRCTQTNVWGHLIKRSLYKDNDIYVIEGVDFGEDLQVFPRLVFYARSIAVLHEYLYYYYKGNELSYTNNYKRVTGIQAIKSNEVIERFVADKDDELKHADRIGMAACILNRIVSSARAGDKEFYLDMIKYADRLPKYSIEAQPFSYKLSYRLRLYPVVRLYTIIGHIIKVLKR